MIESIQLSLHIVRRNWAVYQKDFIANISPTLADPLFFILALGLGLGAYVTELDGRSYLTYIAPGLAISTALYTSFFESSYGFYVRMAYEKIFDAMLTTPIGTRDIVWGEFIWVALKGAIMASGVSLVLALFGLMQNPILLLWIPITGALVAIPCGALGLLATAWVRNINQFQSIYSFLISPLFFLSGIFYPLSNAHPTIRVLAYLFPLSHGVDIAQAVFWNLNLGGILLHFTCLILQSLVLCSVATVAIQRKLQK